MASKETHESRITGAASVVGSFTVLSRILGYIRDGTVAYVFGAGMQADAFFAAFRIANLLRRLVGEGALTSSFIPIFTDVLSTRSTAEARRVSSSVFTLFAFILIALSIIGILASDWLVWAMSPGFAADPAKFHLTVRLTQFMFPYMLFIGLMAIAMGVLNSLKHFAAPAAAPIFLNISIVACVFLAAPFLKEKAYSLAIGVLIGGVMQFAVQLPYLKKFSMSPSVSFAFFDPAIKKIFLLMGPAAFGVGVYQLNLFVTMWFASGLAEGSVSYLYYAGRLMEIPIGVFGVAVSTAVLPSLSEHAAKEEWAEFRSSVSFALRIVGFVTIPATVGLIILNRPIIEALFKRGSFGGLAVDGTSSALFYYALGLVPVSISRILASVFYSRKDAATPVWAGLASFVFNVIFSFLLIGSLSHSGLALAASLAAFANMLVLAVMLRLKFGRFGLREILGSGMRAVAASLVMGAVIFAIMFFVRMESSGYFFKAALLAVCVSAGIAVYLFAAKILKVRELSFLKGFLNKGAKTATEIPSK